MLTKEVLKANAALAALTDDQLAIIEQLSQNDENTVIGQKVGEIHRQYDDTILKSTGISRVGDEKSYDYLARAAGELKTKAESTSTLETSINELKAEKTRLEKLIQDGGNDTELKSQLERVKTELNQTKEQFTQIQNEKSELEKTHTSKLHDIQVDFELNKAKTGLKLKPEFPVTAAGALIQQAMEKIKKNSSTFEDDGNGGKRLVFLDANGAPMNNPANGLKPFTATELLTKEVEALGILAEDSKRKGGGTQPPKGGGADGGVVVDISSARTKVEATEFIGKSLAAQGLAKGSAEYQAALDQAWKDNAIGDLPDK